jgi:replicative DNA helicase
MIRTETTVDVPTVELSRDQIKFSTERLELFCKQSALRLIIVDKSPELIINNKLGELESLIRTAISIRVDKDTGISFFDKIEERAGQDAQVTRFSTGYADLDQKMDGGIARTEMMLVLAISGGGKSVSILNFGLNLIKQKENGKYLNCLCVSLELSEKMFDKRTQMIISDKSSIDVNKNVEDVHAIVNAQSEFHGDLVIKKMRLGTTANDIRALIKEIEIERGWVPDARLP